MNYGIPHIVSQSKDWNVSSLLLSSLSVEHSLPFDVKEKYSTFQYRKDWDSFWKQSKHYHSWGHPDSLPSHGRLSASYKHTEGLPLPKTWSTPSMPREKKTFEKFPSYPWTKSPPHFHMNWCTKLLRISLSFKYQDNSLLSKFLNVDVFNNFFLPFPAGIWNHNNNFAVTSCWIIIIVGQLN